MPELLKNMFNYESLNETASAIKKIYPSIDLPGFMQMTMDEFWDDLQLKARCRKISTSLGAFLPPDYETALGILEKAVQGYSYAYFFPDFIEVYGLEDANWELSVRALERTTQYWSSEFAVRAFIIKDQNRMMRQMYVWSEHDNEHVRRLASEGCRPQLPWGQTIVSFKKDSSPIIPVLEQLKDDSSLYVRKSVANNLNDISKTHPDLVLDIAKKWYGVTDNTDRIIKQGCRTLLKKGNSEALAFFKFDDTDSVVLMEFGLESIKVLIGDNLKFYVTIAAKKNTKARLEYGIDFVKANGKSLRKIFKISEVSLKENEKRSYKKEHSFADLSTRKHYPGIHSIAIIINGTERKKIFFSITRAVVEKEGHVYK